MNKLCAEPNPLGDEIIFFSSNGTESYKNLAKNSRNATKKHANSGEIGEIIENEGVEEEKDTMTVRQHQKYLIAYEKEADDLASNFADRSRMRAQIGKLNNL